MVSHEEYEKRAAEVAERLSELCSEHKIAVAVAESLTGGRIASHLAAAEGSGEWFVGGVVAYSSEIKHQLLDVPPGSVISQVSVETMARSVLKLMGADAAVAASGAGGPGRQEGREPGTTWLAVAVGPEVESEMHSFTGEPIDILAQTQECALTMLLKAVQDHVKTEK